MTTVEVAASLVVPQLERVRNTRSQAGLRRDDVVHSLRKRIGCEEGKAPAEPTVDPELGRVVTRTVVVPQIARLRVEEAPRLRIEDAVVHVLRGGGLAVQWIRSINGRIPMAVPFQLLRELSDITH